MSQLLFAAVAPAVMVFAPPIPLHTKPDRCSSAHGPVLQVEVSGLMDAAGSLRAELYPATTDDFLKDDRALLNEHKVFRRVVAPIPLSGTASLCIETPGSGQYAVIVIHDREGRSKFDIWHDGVGLPGSARLGRNRPAVSQAIVIAGQTGGHVYVRMQYMRGLRGFAPLDR